MMASGPKGRSTLILAWKMTTRTLVSALRHLLPGASDSATAASEPMCSKSSECIFRGGSGAGEPAGDASSSSISSASACACCWNPSAGCFSATIICERPRIKDRAGGSARQRRERERERERERRTDGLPSAERSTRRGALGVVKKKASSIRIATHQMRRGGGGEERRRMGSAVGLGFRTRAARNW